MSDPTAYVAATAVIRGDVTIGLRTHVSFGAVIEAHGAPVRIGAQCVVRENLNKGIETPNPAPTRWATPAQTPSERIAAAAERFVQENAASVSRIDYANCNRNDAVNEV